MRGTMRSARDETKSVNLRRGQCDIGAIEFRVKKSGHHSWNDDDHDEGEDAWSREQFDEGFDQPSGNTQTPER